MLIAGVGVGMRGQVICEQIRKYTVGILSMDPYYMSPEEVDTVDVLQDKSSAHGDIAQPC